MTWKWGRHAQQELEDAKDELRATEDALETINKQRERIAALVKLNTLLQETLAVAVDGLVLASERSLEAVMARRLVATKFDAVSAKYKEYIRRFVQQDDGGEL